jgi:hypothetical protein
MEIETKTAVGVISKGFLADVASDSYEQLKADVVAKRQRKGVSESHEEALAIKSLVKGEDLTEMDSFLTCARAKSLKTIDQAARALVLASASMNKPVVGVIKAINKQVDDMELEAKA